MNNKILFITLGLLFLIYMIYNRFFRTQNLFSFAETLSTMSIIIYMLLSILFFILRIYYIIKFYKLFFNLDKESYLSLLYKKLYQNKYNPLYMLNESLTDLDAFIKNNFFSYDDRRSYLDVLLLNLGLIFYKYKKISLILLFLLRLIPKTIVCFCFYYDILYHNQFTFFYKSLFLLFLPPTINYILYSLQVIIDSNLESLNGCTNIICYTACETR